MPVPDPIINDARYRVQVARPVAVGAAKFYPRSMTEMTGSFLSRLITEHGADAIRSATAI